MSWWGSLKVQRKLDLQTGGGSHINLVFQFHILMWLIWSPTVRLLESLGRDLWLIVSPATHTHSHYWSPFTFPGNHLGRIYFFLHDPQWPHMVYGKQSLLKYSTINGKFNISTYSSILSLLPYLTILAFSGMNQAPVHRVLKCSEYKCGSRMVHLRPLYNSTLGGGEMKELREY